MVAEPLKKKIQKNPNAKQILTKTFYPARWQSTSTAAWADARISSLTLQMFPMWLSRQRSIQEQDEEDCQQAVTRIRPFAVFGSKFWRQQHGAALIHRHVHCPEFVGDNGYQAKPVQSVQFCQCEASRHHDGNYLPKAAKL